MERNEMINTLVRKANISVEEAQEVLEKCNWDLLDAIVYLERRGKVENNEVTALTVVEVKEEKEDKKKQDEKYGGIGEIVGRMFKFIGKIIRKGTKISLRLEKIRKSQ